MSISKTRQSNIELLRCIAIFLILVVHANYFSFGTPTPENIRLFPEINFAKILIENISVICVNVFILISGWFGIHPKFKSIGGFLFQCIFICFCSYIFYSIKGNSLSILSVFSPFKESNFITSYILMYLFTPIMNSFIESSSRKAFQTFLVFFYFISFTGGWLLFFNDFNVGKSTLSFMGLYLLARFVRIHTHIAEIPIQHLIIMYLMMLLGTTSLVWGVTILNISDHLSNILLNITTSYASPIVVVMSLLLLLIFSKLNFHSKAINWIATSAFAVVLIHGKIFAPTGLNGYSSFFQQLYNNHSLLLL